MITNSPARIVQNEVGSPEQKNLQIRPEEILKNIVPEMDLLEKFIIHDIDTDVELLNTVAHHSFLREVNASARLWSCWPHRCLNRLENLHSG